ncbi:hypothetical protein [Paraburkholderia silvatlantica]|uniref:hypothetical protein n=1 Tax=Paraburkholderia silvatlantica TaxID=321895 RepID=UPI00375130B5
MTPAKNRAALQGQTTIARKVYDLVPMQEAWPASRIYGLLAKNANIDLSIVLGCLTSLKDTGLVRDVGNQTWQRVPVRGEIHAQGYQPEEQGAMPPPPAPAGERPNLTLAQAPAQDPKPAPLDLLAGIALQLRDLGKAIASVASEIESAALVIAEGNSETEANLDKLRQLQTLLKSLSIA